MRRRRLLQAHGALLALLCAPAPPAAAQSAAGTAAAASWPRQVVDAAGRTVTIARPPGRILLGSGFNLIPLSLLHPDPVSLVVAWANDLKRVNPPMAEAFERRFPRLATLPLIGDNNAAGLSLEHALSAAPDLALMSGWHYWSDTGRLVIQRLQDAGIPTLVLNFSDDPLANTPRSMRALGQAIGREAQAEAFSTFYEQRVAAIRAKVAARPEPRPRVILQAFGGSTDCCWVWNNGGLGSLLAALGVRNIGAEVLPPAGLGGTMYLESMLAQDPEVYVTTGLPRREFTIGPGVTQEQSRASLAQVVRGAGLSSLSAARHGRLHGLWNHFNAVPLNLLAFEAMARWCRPDLFPALDPAATLAEINSRFAALPFEGTFWVSVDPAQP
ncbi:ferrichrome ABC transporter [Pseudoroseomonas deserti]|uniref:Ferrichrome ABC transporter n=1 Tax=Teichococcus deserti TaxID=1817963 RepID=A0A1V2H5J4_9PROT|nr:ABC transporter substrate-binding protein [Pseudoroseomonas deserti]ONG54974.1 ferrichrome ABC transporter [Pseudoroseomonas deserti]